MISNPVQSMPGGPGPSRPAQSGRAASEADNAFRDALDKSEKAGSEAAGSETETAESKSGSSMAGTRWRDVFSKVADGEGADAGNPDKESGELAGKERGGKSGAPAHGAHSAGHGVKGLAGKDAVADKDGQGTGDAEAEPGETTANAAIAAAVVVDAAAKNAAPEGGKVPATALSAAGVKSANSGKVTEATDATGSAADEGKSDPASLGAQPNGSHGGAKGVAASDHPAGRAAAGQAPSMAPGERNALSTASGVPGAGGGDRGQADRQSQVNVRVSGDARTEASNRATRPTGDPAGISVKAPDFANLLVGNIETPAGRQVADTVARQMEELTPSRLSLTGSTTPGGRTIKTMRLQLHPAELGVVNIRLHSVNGELRVTIQADSDQTARMLHGDSDAIRSALRAAGMSGADVVVTNNRNNSAQQQNFAGQHREHPGQQMDGQQNRQNASSKSRQSYRESSSNDSARTSARGGDAGNGGIDRGSRIVI